jgi:16S rRNA (uracil1498-N3)-methyltransferase
LLQYLGAMSAAAPQLLRLVLEPERDARTGHTAQIGGTPDLRPTGAVIAIGPEGGFAPEELDAFDLCAFSRIGMGPRVLRTETAAIAAVVMLQARFGDMSVLSDEASRTEDA